jgi:hypothetical protein
MAAMPVSPPSRGLSGGLLERLELLSIFDGSLFGEARKRDSPYLLHHLVQLLGRGRARGEFSKSFQWEKMHPENRDFDIWGPLFDWENLPAGKVTNTLTSPPFINRDATASIFSTLPRI